MAVGRDYVKAYVAYAHLVEQLHGVTVHGAVAPHHEAPAITHAD